MKKVIFLNLFFACLCATGFAQTKPKNAWGYVQGGIGGDSSDATVFIGVGAEGVSRQGVGGGAELAVGAPGLLLSVNGAYHFKNSASKRLTPFVSGGYSHALPLFEKSMRGGNAGGGVQYWFAERLGWRAEFREYIFSGSYGNFHNLRFGLCFR